MKTWSIVFSSIAPVVALVCAFGSSHAAESRYSAPEGYWMPAANATRDTAAGDAIAAAMTVNAVAQRCALIDAAHASAANAARDAWWARNQLMVEAANGYVRYLQAIRQVKRGEDAARDFYAGVFDELRGQSEGELARLFASGGDAQVCDRTVAAYAEGRMDLVADQERGATLAAIDRDLREYRSR